MVQNEIYCDVYSHLTGMSNVAQLVMPTVRINVFIIIIKRVGSARLREGENTLSIEDPNPTQPTHGSKKREKSGNKKKEQIRSTRRHWVCF